jgi:Protein of unknown function (DUF1475)
MTARKSLLTLFIAILAVMLTVTGWATLVQPVWEWGGLTTPPDHAWTIATLADAYCGFLTFFAWVCFKERSLARRIGWFVGIVLLGNIAMATYVLKELHRLRPEDSIDDLLTRKVG